jgi:predicted helicase
MIAPDSAALDCTERFQPLDLSRTASAMNLLGLWATSPEFRAPRLMTMTFQNVIERFRASSLSNRERGDKFEALVKRFLQLDPLYAGLFSEVWLWMEWPGRDRRTDTGIDLVAREAHSGDVWAIQCKFYEHGHTVSKEDIDKFLSASGKIGFAKRLIVSTTDGAWSANAEETLVDQQVPVQRIGLSELAAAPIDWSFAGPPEELALSAVPAKKNEPKPHQRAAIEAVFEGFAHHDRGKLIMACGTGKTFTSLAIAERLAAEQSGRARILFLVPSIALLGQTLREWSANSTVPLYAFAVCSDVKVGRARAANDLEDIHVHDLAIPATTDTKALATALRKSGERDGLTVVFSTYQSIAVVSQAQRDGVPDFDLVVCDEAHRTTGITLVGTDESSFKRVHDENFIRSSRRLYMTATPRLYSDTTKKQATDADALLASMDDESLYGPEFHRLSFGVAVENNLLTDYKVLVLTVDKGHIAETMQRQLAENRVLNLDEMARIVGCWNALAKRTGAGQADIDFAGDTHPMKRAVAFLSTIKGSQKFARVTPEVTKYVPDADGDRLRLEVEHVDGTMNALERAQRLDWLKAPVTVDECRILSNARCLSEGVDVPSLDSVLFLSPRNSDVDVVQSVGRVMRKSEGKQYGYIILPIAVAAGVEPEEALRDHKTFKAVWQVLQALRAHDERFDAIVNTIELNPARAMQKIGIGHVGPGSDGDDPHGPGSDNGVLGAQLVLDLPEWREAIYARIVQKVGVRTYWEDWAHDVAEIAAAQQTRIHALLNGANPEVTQAFDTFVQALRANLNESITADAAIGMLSQHLITKPVFDALFEDYAFAEHNPVSQAMEKMVASLGDQNLDAETQRLERFYESVRRRAEGIENAEGKQKIIKELYERFFRKAFAKTAQSLGIVYTPTEIIDFILRGADDALRQEFGMAITDEGVHVFDPFTGTGTFIARLLQSGLIKSADLPRKYTHELHANELLLLAYYIAAVNIEATYHGILGGEYVPFEGIALTDTFQISEEGDLIDELIMPANNARITRQLHTDITVIIGNPPYSVGQANANDDNPNLKYPTLDQRIQDTYGVDRGRGGNNAVYDSYIRAIRWATDRVGDRGVVAFVTNGGWIDGTVHNGTRRSLAAEFSTLYVYNLRGNTRTSGEDARREGGQTFGPGSRATIAILIGVKDPIHEGPCRIRYRDIGDYVSRDRKLEIVASQSLANIAWTALTPNADADWINQRDATFSKYVAIGAKHGDLRDMTVFEGYSRGLETGRDAWVYNSSRAITERHCSATIDHYNAVLARFDRWLAETGSARNDVSTGQFLTADAAFSSDPTRISWTHSLRNRLKAGKAGVFEPAAARVAAYRPFCEQWAYVDRLLNHISGRIPECFPTSRHTNIGFYVVGVGSDKPFSALMVDEVPDLAFWGSGSGQFFPRWRYEPVSENDLDGSIALFAPDVVDDAPLIDGYQRIDNVTDAILADYRDTFGPFVTKDHIFHYVYAVLHSKQYRETFAADLRKMLPRIPQAASLEDFQAFVGAGFDLADLHIRYEEARPYQLEERLTGAAGDDPYDLYRVTKMRFAMRERHDTLIYNEHLTLTGIPEEAYRYQLGSRSAIEWIIARYRVTTHATSGIVNDPNDWCREQRNPRYIVDLLRSIVTVSLETMKIVDSLPPLLPDVDQPV